MSGVDVKKVPVAPDEVRDYYQTHEASANKTFNPWDSDGVVGLDWACYNRGAAAVTVLIDGTHTVTVPAGEWRGFDNIKYGTIKVTASTAYTLAIAGVVKKQRRGMI